LRSQTASSAHFRNFIFGQRSHMEEIANLEGNSKPPIKPSCVAWHAL
jgi:hypothetical protein